ncbi:MAG: hypothetical protein Q9195_009608 [Heterodermia aff. obscurata]
MTTFETALRSANVLNQYRESWNETLADCNVDAIVPLLLLHTPNLERLNIRTIKDFYIHIPPIFQASVAAVTPLLSKATMISPCLQRLKDVSLDFGAGCNPLVSAKLFMSLPSVTSITITGISGSGTILYPIHDCVTLPEVTLPEVTLPEVTLPEASSSVTDIWLSGEFTDRAELSEILKGCKNLTRLSVDFIRYSPYHIRQICCPDVIAILQDSAEHSLEFLRLRASLFTPYNSDDRRDYSYDDRDLIDCTAFKNLCQIDVGAQMLLKRQEQQCPKAVVDRLPHSLQQLCLTYNYQDELDYERDSLRALENPKVAQLPNLRLLQVDTLEESTAYDIAHTLSGDEERFGLDYVIHGKDFYKTFYAVDSDDNEDAWAYLSSNWRY